MFIIRILSVNIYGFIYSEGLYRNGAVLPKRATGGLHATGSMYEVNSQTV